MNLQEVLTAVIRKSVEEVERQHRKQIIKAKIKRMETTDLMERLYSDVKKKRGRFNALDILSCDGRTLGGLLRRGMVEMYYVNGKPFIKSTNTSLIDSLDLQE